MLVNLSNAGTDRTQYLKVKIVLELPDPNVVAQIQPLMPRVMDAFQTYLRELRPTDLDGSAGLYRLKEELTRRVNAAVPTRIFTGDSTTSSDGKGSVDRTEALQTNVAGVVTQVLPNGNLVIEGRQEIQVNFEIRELIVAGVVRPEDIESDNTIDSSKIAQARIAYGGRGQIMDVQQPRYGQQVLDVVLPF